ncbi:hypothetical protein CLOM_g12694 [Closterium sp. NIES-68]|nr:hypothetical protein CLOM_g12694 [Closterium sp. NIES-68]GJP57953.1 hypothetical protein CLOP_g19778 [Closterium sp. NIES-67]GJP79905.1 hypothetical protein CLOP_g10120 [Closterium sp. NIES-67]
MASSRFSLLAASLAVLLLATATSAFARHYAASGATVKPAATAAACTASTLAGYAKSVKLTADGLLLFHWNVTKNKNGIVAAVEAKAGSGGETGWISVGWTKKAGMMSPADAVVGNLAAAAPNNVLAYSMSGKVLSKIKKTTAVKLSAKSVVTSADSTIVKFTRTAKGGVGPISYTGNNNMIWAFSDAKAFTSHTQRGSILVNLACTV